MQFKPEVRDLLDNMRQVIRGKDDVLETSLVCLLAGGHLLIEDIPGVGKTTLAYAIAKSIGGKFSRIQFTSDLLPSDVTGVSIYDPKTQEFRFFSGPVFANVVLADEINRSSPKTQSSLLECMERTQITVEGNPRELPRPFMVIATQNPLEFEGTYPLPENQLDRFLMRTAMGYPGEHMEKEILRHPTFHYDDIHLEPTLDTEGILKLQKQVQELYIESDVLDYILRWVHRTRENSHFRYGISTRGAIALKKVSQARALLQGRNFVIPEDVDRSILPVFSHRLLPIRTHETRNFVEAELNAIAEQIEKP